MYTQQLKAMEEAFNLAAELDMIRVVFETDVQVLAMALNSRKPDWEAAIIEDLKVQSRTWFSSHELAKHGLGCDVNSTLLWEYVVPESASFYVMGDSAQIVS
jgi:hypothetical protein